MEKYIISIKKQLNEQNEECMCYEFDCDKPLLKNGFKHCKHFFILCKDENELKEILKDFSFEGE